MAEIGNMFKAGNYWNTCACVYYIGKNQLSFRRFAQMSGIVFVQNAKISKRGLTFWGSPCYDLGVARESGKRKVDRKW